MRNSNTACELEAFRAALIREFFLIHHYDPTARITQFRRDYESVIALATFNYRLATVTFVVYTAAGQVLSMVKAPCVIEVSDRLEEHGLPRFFGADRTKEIQTSMLAAAA